MFKGRKPGRTFAKDALPALEIHLLCHGAIEPFSLTVKQGEIFGFVGPAGSGKSTIIDLLSGRKAPIDGAIRIMGYDTLQNTRQTEKLVGVVPSSDPNTPSESDTPLEHLHFQARLIGMSERMAHKRIPLVVATVGLTCYEHLQVNAFSSAFKQRLALARALLNDPALVLFDEPTREMEEQERRAFWKLLLTLKGDRKTILLATRDWEEVSMLCDRVAHLSQGKLQAIWERAVQQDAARTYKKASNLSGA